jgi:hypothetical protein
VLIGRNVVVVVDVDDDDDDDDDDEEEDATSTATASLLSLVSVSMAQYFLFLRVGGPLAPYRCNLLRNNKFGEGAGVLATKAEAEAEQGPV